MSNTNYLVSCTWQSQGVCAAVGRKGQVVGADNFIVTNFKVFLRQISDLFTSKNFNDILCYPFSH